MEKESWEALDLFNCSVDASIHAEFFTIRIPCFLFVVIFFYSGVNKNVSYTSECQNFLSPVPRDLTPKMQTQEKGKRSLVFLHYEFIKFIRIG